MTHAHYIFNYGKRVSYNQCSLILLTLDDIKHSFKDCLEIIVDKYIIHFLTNLNYLIVRLLYRGRRNIALLMYNAVFKVCFFR